METSRVQHIFRCEVLTFSPRGFSGTEIGAPTMNLRGALLGKGVTPHRPTTRYGTGNPNFLYVHACSMLTPRRVPGCI